MSAEGAWDSLVLNRNLIDPLFDGYKLSLDTLPKYQLILSEGVDTTVLSERQFSYQHSKAFGIHNHLHADIYNTNVAFYVDAKWRIQRVTINADCSISGPDVVYELPDAANLRLVPDRVSVGVHFPSAEWAVVSNGATWLHVLHTGNRLDNNTWKVHYSGQPLGDTCHFLVVNSALRTNDISCHIDALCLHVDESTDITDDVQSFITKLDWITLQSDNNTKFDILSRKTLHSFSCPDYAAVLPGGKAVVVCCEKPISFLDETIDVKVPVTTEVKNGDTSDADPTKTDDTVTNGDPAKKARAAYTWMQSDDDVTVQLTLPSHLTKTDVAFKLTYNHLSVGVVGGDTLLAGELAHFVDVGGSTWTLSDRNRLEIHLSKQDVVVWQTVVVGDTRGERVLTVEEVDRFHEQMGELQSALAGGEPGGQKAYNVQQLEDCDTTSDDRAALWVMNADKLTHTQQISTAGNQCLFATQCSRDVAPAFCLRHDVDGVLWQPTLTTDGRCSWLHAATFHAFGYVQASKQQRKFIACAADFSYVALADCRRHVYVYRRPAPIVSPLRNRKTGQTVGAVAKQQLVTIDSADEIIGMIATNAFLAVLAGNVLHVMAVNVE